MALTDDRVMTPADDENRDAPPPRSVPRYVALMLFGLVLVTSSFAVYFAARAADAAADAEILADGVDRSRLPPSEAVALAQLSRSRSAIVPNEGGHDHGDSPTETELTAEERQTLTSQWATATAAVPLYDTLEEAEAAGYVKGSSLTDGAGSHWIKWSLVDRPFDPAQPSMLLMDELVRGNGPELIAFSYWVASAEQPEGFAGDDDQWHRHLDLCFDNGYIVDQDVPRNECHGDWINGTDLWMLHTWVVPGVENRLGQFANVNPLLCERACGLND
jgi:hypothetical protein